MRSVKFIVLLALLLLLSACVDKTVNLKPLKVACLGDSITYGHRLPNPLRQSYPARLRVQAGSRWKVMNLGKNGATVLTKGDIPIVSQEVYRKAMDSQPDVVVVLLGTNDIKENNWCYRQDFVKDYHALILNLQALPSNPRIIACLIPPIFIQYPNGLSEKRVHKINILLQQAILNSGVESLDLHDPLSGKPGFFIDGVHPNPRGAQEIANLVFERINSKNVP